MASGQPDDLGWLVDDLVRRVAGVQRAVLLSADGLLMARSSGLTQTDAEHLAAVGSAYRSLSRGTAAHFEAGEVRQTVVEMDTAFLLVAAAGTEASLAVFAAADADLGLVAYEMNRMVARVGSHLSARPRVDGERPATAARA